MKILVTGGAGFIGSWVAELLIRDGHHVLILDDISSGKEENIPKDAEFIREDIKNHESLDRIFNDFKPEVINHHAAQINVRKSVEDPTLDAKINIIGTLNLLELSKKYNIEKFIFASTGGAIYGEPEIIPTDENAIPQPISPYGVSKYAVESYLSYYKAVYGLSFVALRYSNVYGPRQDPHGEAGVIAIFCNRIISGDACVIFGDGTQTRDYVFVGDVARANLLSLSAPDGIYNIGTEKETSVNDLAILLHQSSEKPIKVENSLPRDGEVRRIALNIQKAKDVLDWTPNISLEDGIAQTWKWFENNLSKSQNLQKN
ncbi:NAD-dependent epimerase/dehydratase family protein [Desulfobacterota bacterium AH_259_B03_O07]|nr:NAD-dependent epimerase/dehydratase family protein [Desulfobacterota bacterium AH_259_B03_O07]